MKLANHSRMAPFSPKDTLKRWLQCLKVEKRLIDVEDDQRKGGHVIEFRLATSVPEGLRPLADRYSLVTNFVDCSALVTGKRSSERKKSFACHIAGWLEATNHGPNEPLETEMGSVTNVSVVTAGPIPWYGLQ